MMEADLQVVLFFRVTLPTCTTFSLLLLVASCRKFIVCILKSAESYFSYQDVASAVKLHDAFLINSSLNLMHWSTFFSMHSVQSLPIFCTHFAQVIPGTNFIMLALSSSTIKNFCKKSDSSMHVAYLVAMLMWQFFSEQIIFPMIQKKLLSSFHCQTHLLWQLISSESQKCSLGKTKSFHFSSKHYIPLCCLWHWCHSRRVITSLKWRKGSKH